MSICADHTSVSNITLSPEGLEHCVHKYVYRSTQKTSVLLVFTFIYIYLCLSPFIYIYLHPAVICSSVQLYTNSLEIMWVIDCILLLGTANSIFIVLNTPTLNLTVITQSLG